MGTGPLDQFRIGFEKIIKPPTRIMGASMKGNNEINLAIKGQVMGKDTSAVASNLDRIQQLGNLPPLFEPDKDLEQAKKRGLAIVLEKTANVSQILEKLDPNSPESAEKINLYNATLKNLGAMRAGIEKAPDASSVAQIAALGPGDVDFEKKLFQLSNSQSELNRLRGDKLGAINQKLGEVFDRMQDLNPRDAAFQQKLLLYNATIDGLGRMGEGIEKAPDASSVDKIAALSPDDVDFEKKLFELSNPQSELNDLKADKIGAIYHKLGEVFTQVRRLNPRDEDFQKKLSVLNATIDGLGRMSKGIEKAPDASSVNKMAALNPSDVDFEKKLFRFSNAQNELNLLKADKISALDQKLDQAFDQSEKLSPRDAHYEKKLKALNATIDGLGRMKEGIEKAPDASSVNNIAGLSPDDVDLEKKLLGSTPLTESQSQEYNKLWGGYANDERYPDYPNDANRALFMKLSPEDRQTFCDLRKAIAGDKSACDYAEGMLDEFTVDPPHVDAQGRSLLGVLKDAMAQELCPQLAQLGMDKKTLLAQLVKELSGNTITQGKGTDTCATASLQNNIATKMPAEYARIVTDLLMKGEATIKEGTVLKLSTKALSSTDGRPELDDLVQGTFIDFARQFPKETNETYSGRGGAGGSYRGSTELPGGGISANQIQSLYRFVTGKPPAVVRVTPENKEKVMEAMRAAGAAGYDITAGIHLDGDPEKGHAINLTQFSPPELFQSGENLEMLTSLSIEDSEGSYRAGVKLEHEIENIDMIVIPEEFAQGFSKNDALTYDWSGAGRGGSGGSSR
ncbi:MAG TPA: hypothetical protein DD435_07965 [Cyanobacteria bacterium UBA8530]|nr:hypothetical protein [Cyanobacteria bacterium UBA8530]